MTAKAARATAAALRRYRAEWRAAIARRDYAATRSILGAALSAVSEEGRADLDVETQALNELLALERRLQDIIAGEVRARVPPVRQAFAVPSTRRFRGTWDRAIAGVDYEGAARILRQAIAALSRRIAKRANARQALVKRLKRLQRAPLEFNPTPTRCAFCGGTNHPGVDSGKLFVCTECIEKACEILDEAGGAPRASEAT